MKKFIIINSILSMVCVVLSMLIMSEVAKSTFVFAEGSIIISGILTFIVTSLHIFGYDSAKLDLNTGRFNAVTDFKDKRKQFLLFTEVKPLESEENTESTNG